MLQIGVFHMSNHMRNRAQRDINLSVNVSDKGEVVLRGMCLLLFPFSNMMHMFKFEPPFMNLVLF
jgi:hypothetical protein